MPIQISSFDHLVLTVADVAATCVFYEKVLGMEVVVFDEGRTALSFGHQKINLHQAGAEFEPRAMKAMPGSGDLCLISPTPVAEILEHLQECGIEVIEGPAPKTGAVGPLISVYFRDPDDNLIEVSNLVVD